VHGIAIAGHDDHDEMGVYVEPPEQLFGLAKNWEHYVFRTQPEGARSGPGDTDLVSYGLRKYLRLAVKGNPTALLPLYARGDDVLVLTPLGEELRALAPRLLSRHAVRRFLGYLEAQRRRLLLHGTDRGTSSRPELVERYGYDVKYASHALRLAYQGREVARDARLTLPMPPAERARVLAVKRGDVPDRDEVLVEIDEVRAEVEGMLSSGRTPLPEEPDLPAVQAWCIDAYRRSWGWTGPSAPGVPLSST
jgi:hypothetical protein